MAASTSLESQDRWLPLSLPEGAMHFRNRATNRLSGVKDGNWPSVILNDDFRAGAQRASKSKRLSRWPPLRDSDYVLSHKIIIRRQLAGVSVLSASFHRGKLPVCPRSNGKRFVTRSRLRFVLTVSGRPFRCACREKIILGFGISLDGYIARRKRHHGFLVIDKEGEALMRTSLPRLIPLSWAARPPQAC